LELSKLVEYRWFLVNSPKCGSECGSAVDFAQNMVFSTLYMSRWKQAITNLTLSQLRRKINLYGNATTLNNEDSLLSQKIMLKSA